jgi:xanthine/uracil permease
MPLFVFSLIMALFSFGATIVIVLLIVSAVNKRQRIRKEMFTKMLEAGIYDPKFLRPTRRSVAPLGWGIFFAAVGVALIIGLSVMGIFREGVVGALIPLFIGAGLITYHTLLQRGVAGETENDKPIRIEPKHGGPPPVPPSA